MLHIVKLIGLNLVRCWRCSARPLLMVGLLAAAQSQAAIRHPANLNGLGSELILLVYDATLRMSYTKDLGLNMNDFFAQGQSDSGFQEFFVVDPAADVYWDRFLKGTSGLDNATWAVFAIDDLGAASTAGNKRIFTTVAQGKEGNLASTSNPKVSNITTGVSSQFYFVVNNLGTHIDPSLGQDTTTDAQVAINGSALYDPSAGHPADADITPVFNLFNASPSITPLNKIGDSSWFYYLTRSGASNLASSRALVDEFDNLGADGYWGFIKESTAGSERYLLSYTLPAFTSVLERTAGITLGNNFARMAGILSLSSAAGKGDAVLGLAEGFLRGMARGANTAGALAHPQAVLAAALAPVPEPQTWTLLLGGLVLVGAAARRRAA